MSTPLQITLIIIAVIAAIVIIAAIVAKSARQNQYLKISASYGKLRKYEFTYEEYESISHYFKNTLKEGELHIDDITWNDLDMDKIFMMINNTNSSVGRDYLYKLLRVPVTNETELKERERLIQYFEEHKHERVVIEQGYDNMGFTRKISISDHVDRLLSLKAESNAPHIIMVLCMIAAVLFTVLIDPVLGLLLILITFGVSIVSYYRTKSRIDSFFTCVRQIVSMINAAKNICSLNIDDLSEYNEKLKKHIVTFRKVTNNSWLLVSGKTTSGNLSDIIMEYVRMFTHVDLIKFNNMLKYLDNKKEDIYDLMEILGKIEAMISIASFRHLLPYFVRPEFSDNNTLSVRDVYHLSIKEPVANSITTDRPVLLTGSNASGKSTFLKSIAINTILAQTINTCPCEHYRAPFYHVMSSMALTDNLDSGESYYIVEIKSLKRIVDTAKNSGAKVLCFIDEVLRGTNTVERISASTEILKNLSESGAMCFAATHDIELTDLLEKQYSNYHFTEEVKDGNVIFSYVLHEGKATSRNAIKLLEIIGYDKSIIEKAENRANNFIKSGIWRT